MKKIIIAIVILLQPVSAQTILPGPLAGNVQLRQAEKLSRKIKNKKLRRAINKRIREGYRLHNGYKINNVGLEVETIEYE